MQLQCCGFAIDTCYLFGNPFSGSQVYHCITFKSGLVLLAHVVDAVLHPKALYVLGSLLALTQTSQHFSKDGLLL